MASVAAFSLVAGGVTAATLLTGAAPASAASGPTIATVSDSSQGWIQAPSYGNNANSSYLTNVIVGAPQSSYPMRDWFSFQLPSAAAGADSATLTFDTSTSCNSGSLLTYSLWDVTTPASGMTGASAYDDLGTGHSYGSTPYRPGAASLTVQLNGQALSDIKAAAGGRWAVGGSVDTGWFFGCTSGRSYATLTLSGPSDTTAPLSTAALDPAPNAAGWNNGPTTVALHATDDADGSGVRSLSYSATGAQPVAQRTIGGASASVPVSEDGTTTVSFAATDNAGNTETTQTQTVKIDTVAPKVTVSKSDPTPNAHGWYATPVTVSFACTDTTSGVAPDSCPAPELLGNGRHAPQRVTVTDNAGNATTVDVPEIDVDTVTPEVGFTGNAGSYTVDQNVDITCAAADDLSGIDAPDTSCPSVQAPAYTLPLGRAELQAVATDNAGNATTTSTSYTVAVTCPSLEALVGRFSNEAGVTNGLNAKLDAACRAPNAQAKAGQVGAFDNQVRAQTGKALTGAQAAVLVSLAGSL